jgi:hypothetical protein
MLEGLRPYVSFRVPRGAELAPGATRCMVTYPGYVVNGDKEVEVARAKFLSDPQIHHEPVDMFGRQGFSSNSKKMKEMEKYMREKGFKKGQYSTEGDTE